MKKDSLAIFRVCISDRFYLSILLVILCFQTGCWAPLRSYGVPASTLPDSFRTPTRTTGFPLNYASLTLEPPADYILGVNDQLDVVVPGLFEDAQIIPFRVQIMSDGAIQLPLVGKIDVGGKNLLEAERAITEAYANGFLVNPQVNVTLFEKDSVSVLVLGEVSAPGVHVLTKYGNDVGHALAAAGGFTDEAADVIEVHRRGYPVPMPPHVPTSYIDPSGSGSVLETAQLNPSTSRAPTVFLGPPTPLLAEGSEEALADGSSASGATFESEVSPSRTVEANFVAWQSPANATMSHGNSMGMLNANRYPSQLPIPATPGYMEPQPQMAPPLHCGLHQHIMEQPENILRIPLRIQPGFRLSREDITLQDGDVVVVPSRRNEVFFVVGRLGTTNAVRFNAGNRDRELGIGLVLPREREIDVVTAVTMAGYIDPIDSPTTVTLQRTAPDGSRLLILVDLIEARCNPRATVLVRAGDIIYLNPDAPWYLRRTIDRILPDLIVSPYQFFNRRVILGDGAL